MEQALKRFSNDAELRRYISKEAASAFFSNTVITRVECDRWATTNMGGTAIPVDIQGLSSYTCYAGPSSVFVVQFRLQSSPVKLLMFDVAKKVHGGLVPWAGFFGDIVSPRHDFSRECLNIYVMQRLPGTTYLKYLLSPGYKETSPDQVKARTTFIADVARFFASSWNNPLPTMSFYKDDLRGLCMRDLQLLLTHLPRSLSGAVQSCIDSLEDIMSLPSVLVHPDFNSGNLLVDETGGRLTGVVDWAGAETGPFGLNLASIEFLTGVLDPQKGWRRYQDYDTLQSIFWTTFLDAIDGLPTETVSIIKTARILGLLQYRGFVGRAGSRVPLNDDDGASKYNMMILGACLANPETRFEDLK